MMLTKDDVFQEYASRGVSPSSELYIKVQDAIEFVQKCTMNNLAIIGIEGFLFENGYLYPQLDIITDYSPTKNSGMEWPFFLEKCNSQTLKILEPIKHKDNLVISLVVFSEEQFSKL